jgi:dTDP-4-amino-4,6-dideoxygalactose transaminase
LIATDSDELLQQLVALRNHGSFERYHHHVIGYNSRLDELQAVVLRSKLRRVDDFNRERRRVAASYNRALADLPGITTPFEDGAGHHVYHQYTLLTDQREAIMAALREAEIASAIYYPIPLHRQDVFREQYRGVELPVAEGIAERCLSLPIYPELSDEQIARITGVVRQAVAAGQ